MNMLSNKWFLAMALIATLCCAACGDDDDDDNARDELMRFQVPLSVTYINTGVEMGPGHKVTIYSNAQALGFEIRDSNQPIPGFGRGGLIGKIGEDGSPFAIGEEKEIQGSSASIGKKLFLGRNDISGAGIQPVIPALEANPEDTAAVPSFDQNLIFNPILLEAYVSVRATNAPGPLAPRDDFFSTDAGPTFDWDDVSDVIQYSLQISFYPDFRSLVYEATMLGISNFNYSELILDVTSVSNQTSLLDTESVYYWRVNAQYNAGRSLALDLLWTEHSVVMTYGYDSLDTGPDEAQIISPFLAENETFKVGVDDRISLEFFAPLHPGGSEWRYQVFRGSCQETLDPDNLSADYVGPWRVYLRTLEGPLPYDPPGHYDYLVTDPLNTGVYIYRIESRSVYDSHSESLSAPTDFAFSVNCN
jgi:hypothetical protein